MPDCEEDLKVVYSHATMTESMIADTNANKDREVVIVTDFDASTIEELDDCTGNNYILAFEYCDPDNNYIKIRRNFVSYEGLASTTGYISSSPNYICSGSGLININSHANYYIITGDEGWSVQKALEDLDAAASEISGGELLEYIKDGPTDGSLKGSDGTTDSIISGTSKYQFNLGKDSTIQNSFHATIFGGNTNFIGTTANGSAYSFMGAGKDLTIKDSSDYCFIGTGETHYINNNVDHMFIGTGNDIIAEGPINYPSSLNGKNGKIDKDHGTILNGDSALVENKGEVVLSAGKIASSFGQSSKIIMNAITTDLNTSSFYLIDTLGSNDKLKIPTTFNDGSGAHGGSLNGNIKISGLYVYDDSPVEVATVEANFMFSAVYNSSSNGYNVSFLETTSRTQSETAGVELDIAGIGIDEDGGELDILVASTVNGEVLWTAAIDYHRQVKNQEGAVHNCLISHWTFDNLGASSVAVDSVGSNNGTLTGNAQFAGTGFVGPDSVENNSGIGTVSVPDDSTLNNPSFTAEGWVQVFNSSYAAKFYVVKGDPNTHSWLINSQNNGNLRASFQNNSAAITTAGSILTPNTWNHFAISYDSNTQTGKLYLNGSLVGSASVPSISNVNAPLIFMRQDTTATPTSLQGRMDDWAYYDCALTDQEISNIHAAGSSGKP